MADTMIPFGLIGTALGGLVNGVFKSNLARRQQRMADAIHPIYTPYEESKYAKQQLDTANQYVNSRMPSAGILERNILSNQGNSLAYAQKNSTDAMQALNLLGGIQGGTNDALQQLQAKEQEYRSDAMGNLNNAYATMIREGDKVYQDKLNKYNIDLQAKAALQGAALQNRASLYGDIGRGIQQAGFIGEQMQANKKSGGSNPLAASSFAPVSVSSGMEGTNDVYYDATGRAYTLDQFGKKRYIG